MISKIWNTSVCVAPPFHPPFPLILALCLLFFLAFTPLHSSFSLSVCLSPSPSRYLSFPALSFLFSFPSANLDQSCAVGIWPPFFLKAESQSLCKYVHVCRHEWLYVSSTEVVCIFCMRIVVACTDVSQSHEALPLAIQQSFNPHHQWPQTPASDLFIHKDTHWMWCIRDHTHTCAPSAPSISSYQCRLAFSQSLKHKGK